MRVGVPYVPVPYSVPFQKMFVPDEQKIIEAIHRVLAR